MPATQDKQPLVNNNTQKRSWRSYRAACIPLSAYRAVYPGLACAAVWGPGVWMRYMSGDAFLADVGFWMMVGGIPAHAFTALMMGINDLEPPKGWWKRKGCCAGCCGGRCGCTGGADAGQEMA